MENRTRANDNKPVKKMAKEVVQWLFFIDRNENRPEKNCFSRLFYQHEDKFIKNFIFYNGIFDRTTFDNIYNTYNTNKLADEELAKEYNNLEKALNTFLGHCKEDYQKTLIKKWNKKKKKDYENFINFICELGLKQGMIRNEENYVRRYKENMRKLFPMGTLQARDCMTACSNVKI